MKLRLFVSAVGAASLAAVVAITASGHPTTASKLEPTLRVGFYGGPIGQAFQEAFVAPFEKATGVDVTVESSFDNVRLTKLRSDPGSLDVAFFTDPVMPDVIAANVPTVFPKGSIPNRRWVYKNLRAPNAFAFSFGVWGIAYNADRVKPAPTSWADLLNDKYQGRLTGPDITFNSSFLTLVAFAKLGGGTLTRLDPGFDRMKRLRGLSPYFWASDAQLLPQLLNGSTWMSAYASGGTYAAAAQPGAPPLRFVIPKEGGYLVPFNLVIPRGAKSEASARAFANFILAPKAQRAWAEKIFYSPANTRTKLPANVLSKVVVGDKVLKLKRLDWRTLSKYRADIITRWQTTIK